jgi:inner membrane protein YidH
MADPTAHSAPGLDLSTKLALDRTWAAYERTMLAWVRTATSLITFGFSVYKFFQIVRAEGERPNYLIGSRQFGLLLVSIGLASLALATVEYRRNIRMLGAQYESHPRSLAVIVAALISILGVVALSLMIFRQ